jgi:hypothetical protein
MENPGRFACARGFSLLVMAAAAYPSPIVEM